MPVEGNGGRLFEEHYLVSLPPLIKMNWMLARMPLYFLIYKQRQTR